MGRELGDQQLVEPADHVAVKVPGVDPVGQVLAEPLFHRQDVGAPGELQEVHGAPVLGHRRDGHLGCEVPHREGHVGVYRVFAVDDDEPGLAGAQGFIGRPVLHAAGDRRHAVLEEVGGSGRVGLDQVVGDALEAKPSDQGHGHAVVAAQDHVPPGGRGHLPGGLEPHPGLEPRGVEEPDEDEGEDDQEEEHPGQEDDDAKQSPHVAVEGDVAEAEGGHHRKGPVDPRDPGVLLSLHVAHDEPKGGGEDRDGGQEQDQVAGQGLGVAPGLARGEDREELAGEVLHGVPRVLPQGHRRARR